MWKPLDILPVVSTNARASLPLLWAYLIMTSYSWRFDLVRHFYFSFESRKITANIDCRKHKKRGIIWNGVEFKFGIKTEPRYGSRSLVPSWTPRGISWTIFNRYVVLLYTLITTPVITFNMTGATWGYDVQQYYIKFRNICSLIKQLNQKPIDLKQVTQSHTHIYR